MRVLLVEDERIRDRRYRRFWLAGVLRGSLSSQSMLWTRNGYWLVNGSIFCFSTSSCRKEPTRVL